MIKTVTINDFKSLFGETEFTPDWVQMFEHLDLRYRELSERERDALILQALKKIDSGELSISGPGRKGDWEKGWAEAFVAFVSSGHALHSLIPKYLRKDKTVRFMGRYILPSAEHFELDFYNLFRHWLYSRYLDKADSIYEFGCGTGYNLAIISKLFPLKETFGLDWVRSSIELVDLIGETNSLNMKGIQFDMANPDYALDVPKTSALLTMNSMEQLGSDYHDLLNFFVEKAPSLCVHAEPFIELYDDEDLMDYLAIRYHKARNYLDGFVNAVRNLERQGKAEIIKIKRVKFGSLYHEAYSLLIWRPLSLKDR